jgi:hypothetical protein
MALSSTTQLSIAELTIYLVLLLPTFFFFFKHGSSAFFGFLYLISFQILRIVSAALQIAERNDARPSVAAAVLGAIGLSPLLLSYAGFLNLFWKYYGASGRQNHLVVLVNDLGVHAGAAAGIALVAVGATKLLNGRPTRSDISTAHAVMEAGGVIAVLTWLTTCLLCAYILFRRQNTDTPPAIKLLMVIAAAFTGVRAIYGIVFAFDHNPNLSPFTGTFAVKLVLIFLTQLFAALALIVAGGVSYRDAKGRSRATREVESREHSVPLAYTATH